MTVSGQPATSLLDSLLSAQTTRTTVDVSMLKKTQDVEKQEGAATVEMLENSAPQRQQGPLLDVYA
jgi:hypothetical protein